ncbi:MAG: Glutathione S-transferase GST-6.0 [Candidatus Celerinatantimonas neptuna]|nr:MAG: Glutathione S-transferase GST-6.0 [Candidatus Celerinatantimonas neptuna]
MVYQLYYYPRSASLLPHMLLHHMSLEYQLVLVDKRKHAQKSCDYLKLNPAGRIPTLVDDGLVIFETPAICIHLCEQHSEYDLIPVMGSSKRPLFFQWLSYLNNTLQVELMIRFYPHRHTTDNTNIGSIIAAQNIRIRDILLLIDEQLSDRRYLLGNKISACDFYLFMLAGWALSIEPSPLSYIHLGPYLKSLVNHPTIKSVYKEEGISLQKVLED